MKKFLILLILTASFPLEAKVAVLPYKIFTPELSVRNEYSSLMATSILLNKNTEVVTPEEVQSSMDLLGINPETSLTLENLAVISKKLDLSYIVTGSISKASGNFISKSILYSASSGEIISRRTVTGKNLIELAQNETMETMTVVSQREARIPHEKSDTVFLIDMSYNNRIHWNDIKSSIKNYAEQNMQGSTVSSRIYIIPYSSNMSNASIAYSENSITEINRALDRLSPSGQPDSSIFSSMLKYTIENIKWRKDASKNFFIFNNTKLSDAFYIEKYATAARKKGISINSISGAIQFEDGTPSARLSELTKGKSVIITYRKILYDTDGGSHYTFMNGNRLFSSTANFRRWHELGSILAIPSVKRNMDIPEEIYSTSKFTNPEKIENYISSAQGLKVLRSEKLETNITFLMKEMDQARFKKSGNTIARALVTDGKVNLWVNIDNHDTARSFSESNAKGFYRTTAFHVIRNSNSIYNFDLVPVETSFPFNMVPGIVRVKIGDIIKKPDYYSKTGLGKIPTWFIDVKIQQVKYLDRSGDIRED